MKIELNNDEVKIIISGIKGKLTRANHKFGFFSKESELIKKRLIHYDKLLESKKTKRKVSVKIDELELLISGLGKKLTMINKKLGWGEKSKDSIDLTERHSDLLKIKSNFISK